MEKGKGQVTCSQQANRQPRIEHRHLSLDQVALPGRNEFLSEMCFISGSTDIFEVI